MNFLNRFSIRNRLLAGFAMLLLLLLFVGAMGYRSMGAAILSNEFMYEKTTYPLALVGRANSSLFEIRIEIEHFVEAKKSLNTGYTAQANEERLFQMLNAVDSLMAAYAPTLIVRNDSLMYQKVLGQLSAYEQIVKTTVEYSKDAKTLSKAFATLESPEYIKASRELDDTMDQIVKVNTDGALNTHEKSNAALQKAQYLQGIFIIIGVMIALILSILLTKSITNPLTQLVQIFGRVAKGDLTAQIPQNYSHEIGQLFTSTEQMIHSLKELITSIQKCSMNLAGSSEELSHASTSLQDTTNNIIGQTSQLASASEEMGYNTNSMAAASEEMSVNSEHVAQAADRMSANVIGVSAAIEEMSITIGSISSYSNQAIEISNQATQKSAQASNQMSHLGDSAKEIGKVTDMIKKIAEKTNLLALNATIEAASAGEAGKGFAVVANEIKELANQSAKAAEEISAKIEGIQNNTQNSVQVIQEMSDIIQKVNESIHSISLSVEQQSRASHEISANIGQASHGAQNISTSISELAKGSVEMAQNTGEVAKGVQDVIGAIAEINQATLTNGKSVQALQNTTSQMHETVNTLSHLMDSFTIADSSSKDIGFNIQDAIKAHGLWKSKLFNAIEKGQNLNVAEIAADNCCPLGKWIYSPANRCKNAPGFTQMTKEHAHFHKECGKVAEVINRKDYEQAKQMLAEGSNFSLATQKVRSALKDLDQNCKENV